VNKNKQSKMGRAILLSIPILFIVSAPMHFIFEFTGKLAIMGAVAPVNESPWEHLKLAFYPILVWWIIYYFRGRKAERFSTEKWIAATAVAATSAPLITIIFFYSYTGAFGVESLFIDILSILLAMAAAQYLGFHIYKYANPSKFAAYVSLGVIITLVFMFVLFTFLPLHIPLFMDKNTAGYGIP
jgi:hypothetical protein